MGFVNWAPDIRLGRGGGGHIEEIRRLWSHMKAFTTDSERRRARRLARRVVGRDP